MISLPVVNQSVSLATAGSATIMTEDSDCQCRGRAGALRLPVPGARRSVVVRAGPTPGPPAGRSPSDYVNHYLAFESTATRTVTVTPVSKVVSNLASLTRRRPRRSLSRTVRVPGPGRAPRLHSERQWAGKRDHDGGTVGLGGRVQRRLWTTRGPLTRMVIRVILGHAKNAQATSFLSYNLNLFHYLSG